LSDGRSLVAGNVGRALVTAPSNRLPVVRLGPTQRGRKHAHTAKPAVYLPESGDSCAVLRLKWMASTCLAGLVGVAVIGVAIYASLNVEDGSGIVNSMRRAGIAALEPMRGVARADRDGNGAGLKSDRIEMTSLGVATRHIIHEPQVQRRGEREFITIKPYARVVARLATEPPGDQSAIPSFNPFKLHLNEAPLEDDGSGDVATVQSKDIVIRLIDLPGAAVPREDGIEIAAEEIGRLVAEADDALFASDAPFAMRGEDSDAPDADGQLVRVAYAPDGAGQPESQPSLLPPRNTTIAIKRTELDEAQADILGDAEPDSKSIKVAKGDTLMSICVEAGVDPSAAKQISDTIEKDFRATKLQPGFDIRLTLEPDESDAGAMHAIKISIFDGENHKATVRKTPLGDYAVSDDPVDVSLVAAVEQQREEQGRASLYTSFYAAALSQQIPVDSLEKLLRVHSYDIDFKQRVRPGDGFELFFDTKDGPKATGAEPNEILYTAFTVGGESRGFYRFRTPDGVVDYYDENGDSAKRFLMRNPVRGGRFTSGFGMRKHPLLRIRRMHSGVDYAAPPGTPILAAGDGLVESAGRNGGYGNYIRIRHANGFQTTYGHLSRYAEGLAKGGRVKQGQVIGYVGTTGVSTGPHLHFEVMVDNRFVDHQRTARPSASWPQSGGVPAGEAAHRQSDGAGAGDHPRGGCRSADGLIRFCAGPKGPE
jgi:murein DD-endopeptidase MepM/ murein hydrolase activator NlpD